MPMLILLALLLITVQGSEAPAPDICATCAGEGFATLACLTCEGTSEGSCVHCTARSRADMRARQHELRSLIDPESKILEQAEGTLETLRKLEAAMGMAGVGDSTPPGMVWCPARCFAGRPDHDPSGFLGDPGSCKPCGGNGQVECAICAGSGRGPCVSCAGREKEPQPCPQCLATGRSPGLDACSEANVAVCPWCAGRHVLECGMCDDDHQSQRICPDCAGTGTGLCAECAGGRKAPCKACGSDGEQGSALRGYSKCKACKRRGHLRCKSCKRGTAPCQSCDGEGRGLFPCDRCLGLGMGFCPGCDGARGRAWLTTGERLIESGDSELGLAYLEFGVLRERAFAEREWQAVEGSSRTRKAAEREAKRKISALEKMLKRARADN